MSDPVIPASPALRSGTYRLDTRDRLIDAFRDVDVRMRFMDVFDRMPNDVECDMLAEAIACALYDRGHAIHRDRSKR